MLKLLSDNEVKKYFGTFTYKEAESGRIRIDPEWVDENIETVTIPQLSKLTPSDGAVRFHKKATQQLQNAFSEIERKGLLKYILTWNGSFVPRHITWNPGKMLSRHSWGIAFDINVQWNAYGKKPADENEYGTVIPLVPIFEEHGFVWGGSWKTPDGMHFEVAEVDPKSQYIPLFINGVEATDADVIIKANNSSYGILGPIAKAMGIADESVTSNADYIPVSAFLKSHGYEVEWRDNGILKGEIHAFNL